MQADRTDPPFLLGLEDKMDGQTAVMESNCKIRLVGIDNGGVMVSCVERHGQIAFTVEKPSVKGTVPSHQDGQDNRQNQQFPLPRAYHLFILLAFAKKASNTTRAGTLVTESARLTVL